MKTIGRWSLKLVALSVAGAIFYHLFVAGDVRDEDWATLLFAGLFFLGLVVGSFFSNRYLSLPLGVIFLVVFVQGLVTAQIPNIFRYYHRSFIELASDPATFYAAMATLLVGGTGLVYDAYLWWRRERIPEGSESSRP